MKQILTLLLICVASLTFAQFNDGLTPKGPKMNQGFSVKGNSVTNIEKKTITKSQTAFLHLMQLIRLLLIHWLRLKQILQH